MTADPAPYIPDPLRLLILEDEPNDAILELAVLEDAGFNCQWERVDTRAAFETRLEEPAYDLIISDYALPTFDGLSALKLVAEREIDVPVILVSGTMGEEAAIESLKSGATDYVLKTRLSRLVPVVKRALKEFAERQQREQAEEKVRQYTNIVSNATDLLALIDRTGVYLAANTAYVKAAQKTEAEIIGHTVPEVFSETFYRAGVQPHFEKCLKGEVVHRRDWFEFPACGSRYMDVVYAPYRGPDQSVMGVVVSARDITEAARLEEQLIQAQKMETVGQLAGGVAHDFNNILQAVLGYGELARADLDEAHPVQSSLDQIMKAGERAKQLVNQLLAFSRRQQLSMEYLDLNDVITELVKMVRQVIGEHITLEVVSDAETCSIRADRGQIGQILTNLCVNARDAMPQGGTITISTGVVPLDRIFCELNDVSPPGDFVKLSVADTGCGMDVETIKQIFEPFFTTKMVGKGTGLGLATVYGLVKQHRGTILVNSVLNQGTVFDIYLPLVAEEQRVAVQEVELPLTGGRETILLAEDDELVSEVCKNMLKHSGYTVLSVDDGEQALQMLVEHAAQIDLVLLDVVMPKLGGLAVYQKVHAQHPTMRFLFTSGYNATADHVRFIQDEKLPMLQKPYLRSDLLRMVRGALDKQ